MSLYSSQRGYASFLFRDYIIVNEGEGCGQYATSVKRKKDWKALYYREFEVVGMNCGEWEMEDDVWGVGSGCEGDGMVGNAKGDVRKEQHTL